MKRKNLMPLARQAEKHPEGLRWDLSPNALERWTPNLRAAQQTDNTVSIFDPIGSDPWSGEGVTAKRIAAALRSIGPEKDVVVNVNSPGGDLFEGIAIYNLLRDHKGEVTVKVLGLAASAASLIAMAGDRILVAKSGFFMIHNAWVMAIGNRNDLRDIADELEPFDAAMAEIYAARTGIDQVDVAKMMDVETWISGTASVDQGFADEFLPADEVKKSAQAKSERAAREKIDLIMAKAGVPRTERRALFQEFKAGMPSAAGNDGTPRATEGMPCAAEAVKEVRQLLSGFTLETAPANNI